MNCLSITDNDTLRYLNLAQLTAAYFAVDPCFPRNSFELALASEPQLSLKLVIDRVFCFTVYIGRLSLSTPNYQTSHEVRASMELISSQGMTGM